MKDRPTIVCLCGSARFIDTFLEAYIQETVAGKVVLTIAGNCKSHPLYDTVKPALDRMYRYKIEMADEILVLNVGGYIGDSTKGEIAYARSLGKRIRWWEHNVPPWKRALNKARKLLG